MLAECTWKKYLPTFFGPFLHEYWPTTSIMKKPKFQVLLKWFALFQSTWESKRATIPQILTKIPKENKKHFHSLCDLFETYIPVVLWFEKTKNSHSFSTLHKFVLIQLILKVLTTLHLY